MAFKLSQRTADNIRLIRSNPLIAPLDAGTYTLFYVPHKAFVSPLWVNITTGTDAGNLTIGHLGNKETADTDSIFSAAELQSDIPGQLVRNEGKWFRYARGGITITLPTAITVGELIVFARYTVIH